MAKKQLVLTLGLAAALGACGGSEDSKKTDEQIAEETGRGIVAACPMAAPTDEAARADCAAKLTDLKVLSEHMQEPFYWGGQKAGKGYRLSDSDTTRFNAFVWRRMYLSLFMFTGEVRTEVIGEAVVLHLPFRFRNELDPGSYPYPFWHSKNKWDSWQLAPELIIIMENGKFTGALRSSDRTDPTQADRQAHYVNRTWNGQWTWKEDGHDMPYVTLYKYLFSPNNPHVENLDKAYRALEGEMRASSCLICHAPDNMAKATTLEFFNYPNQALYSRQSIVMHLQENTMPPKANDFGLPEGIEEADRLRMLELAKAFEKAGNDALAFEGELRTWVRPPRPMAATP
jgi:hypothetical protein